MRKNLHIIILLIFSFCCCFCKTEKSKTHKESSEKPKKEIKEIKKTEYKTCVDKKSYKNIGLGNYSYTLEITPNLSMPKNNMEYKTLLIRDKKRYNSGNLKLHDTVINILINKKSIKDLYNSSSKNVHKNTKDSINIDNFHLLTTRYNYARASEIHFNTIMYSMKDSVFYEVSYHFDYQSEKFRFGFFKSRINAIESYKNFNCNIYHY